MAKYRAEAPAQIGALTTFNMHPKSTRSLRDYESK